MSKKENAALLTRHKERGETTNAGSGFDVSARQHSTTARACQLGCTPSAAARRILSPMIHTAQRNRQTRVLDALLELYARWTKNV